MNNRSLFSCLLTAMVLGTVEGRCAAQVLYVDGVRGTFEASGRSRFDAVRSLETALEIARGDSSIREIQVTAGEYSPSIGSAFELVDGVRVAGGYASRFRVRGLGQTVLDGRGSRATVVRATGVSGARLDQLVIRGGVAGSAGTNGLSGAGLALENAQVSASRCRFEGNHAVEDGGALYVGQGSGALISDCEFVGNSAGRHGGGLMVEGVATVIGCRFLDNRADGVGGAIRCFFGDLDLWNSLIASNSAYQSGGIDIRDAIDRCWIGNCTIVDNQGDYFPGGIGVTFSEVSIVNSILLRNYCLFPDWWNIRSIGAYVDVYNCCLNEDPAPFAAIYRDNFVADPNFVDPDGRDDVPGTVDDDYDLHHPALASSPCVDRGDNTFIGGAHLQLDVDQRERIRDPIAGGASEVVDVGAYEVQPLTVLLPGTDEDLALGVLVDGAVSHRFGSDEVLIGAGQQLAVLLESHEGDRYGEIGGTFLDLLPGSLLPSPALSLELLYYSAAAIPLVGVVGSGAPVLSARIPASLRGYTLLLQAMVLDSTAGNGVCVLSNGRVVEVF